MKHTLVVALVAAWIAGLACSARGSALYWSNYRANLDGSDVRTLDDSAGGVGLAIDQNARKLYYTNFEKLGAIDWPAWIWRSNLDGSGRELLISKSAPSLHIDAIAFAPAGGVFAAGKMYWGEPSSIHRADLDGSNEEVVHSTPGGVYSGIGLDLDGRKLYWTSGTSGTIGAPPVERANLDGTGAEPLVNGLSGWATGMAIDHIDRKVYFGYADHLTGDGLQPLALMRSNLDGSGLETVIGEIAGLRAMALDEVGRKLYWVGAEGNGGISRANLDGTGIELVVPGANWPISIAVDPTVPEPGILIGIGIVAMTMLVRRRH